MTPTMERSTIKGIKADFVKRTITVTLETSLGNFAPEDRDKVSEWAENEAIVDCKFSRSLPHAPLLDGVA